MSVRQLKFRAWDKYNKVMVNNPYLYEHLTYCFIDEIFIKHDRYDWMQFTGLLDKSGKEIYENDLLRWDGHDYEIKFINGEWSLWHSSDSEYDRPSLYMIIKPSRFNVEIIGNIYENPDLLETKQ